MDEATHNQERRFTMGKLSASAEKLLALLKTTKLSPEETERPKDDTIDVYDLAQSAEAAAEAHNCHVVKPEPNQLQLDIDNDAAYEIYKKRIYEYKTHSGLVFDTEIHTSKSGFPNRHITLTVYHYDHTPYNFNEWERLALQFALGSDPIRETLNSWRLLTGSDNPSRFFEPND